MNLEYFVVTTKWTKVSPSSPGYLSGFNVAEILSSNNIQEMLNNKNIIPQHFDQDIYTAWRDITVELSLEAPIYGFSSVRTEDNSICYSVAIYESENSYNDLRQQKSELFQRADTIRPQYANLLGLSAEIKKKTLELETEDFLNLITNRSSLTRVEELFNLM